jgi:hypothetical protein
LARHWVVVLVVLGLPVATAAQTVRDLANRGECSTAGLEGLSAQLADSQRCLRPGAFVSFEGTPGVTVTSARVHPYLQASARDALANAAARVPMRINSAFRTLPDQYVLYHSGGCALAAEPGRSNHQTGRALDVDNYSAARSALEAQGCVWQGSSDPVHFDCPGTDRRSDSVLTFQVVWNINHPEDRIDEDGAYGPQTAARLASSPAAGFARDACTCDPSCDGATMIGTDCSRTECGAGSICSLATGAPSCVSPECASDGAPRAHDVCLADGRLGHCTETGVLEAPEECGAGEVCIPIDGEAMCVSSAIDAGVIATGDGGAPLGRDGGTGPEPSARVVSGGCSAGRDAGALAPLGVIAAIAFGRSRRGRRRDTSG